MNDIPPLAWIAIGIVVIIFIGVNASLIALLREGMPRPGSSSGRTAKNIQKAMHVMRNPYEEEKKQLQELSLLVHDLQDHPSGDDKEKRT